MASSAAKKPAHDRWACFDCRTSVKRALVDVRAKARPSYLCPRCREKMTWTGTAFRPPKRDDLEGWEVARQVIATGVRYLSTRSRQRMPRTRTELAAWHAARGQVRRWLPERKLRRTSAGLSWGPRALCDREPALVLVAGRWRAGQVKVRGDGGKRLVAPVIVLDGGAEVVALSLETRLRLREPT